jgi:hypothetical protein
MTMVMARWPYTLENLCDQAESSHMGRSGLSWRGKVNPIDKGMHGKYNEMMAKLDAEGRIYW